MKCEFYRRKSTISVIFKKNFSLLLALRFLNPLRTHVSVITLISLAGVALGVMVLIVVMSVMAGFETMVKDRVLGESPHITLERVAPWDMPNEDGETTPPEAQWRLLQEKMLGLPSVVGAYPLVEDFVIVDLRGNVVPLRMRGIDTEDSEAMADLKKLEVKGDVEIGMSYVADMESNSGPTEVAVISSIFAEANGVEVGDILEVISNRNIQQLKPLLDRKGSPSIYEQKEADLQNARARLSEYWVREQGREKMLYSELLEFRFFLENLANENIRTGERDLLESIYSLTESEDYDDAYNYYPQGRLAEVQDLFDQLKNVDLEALDDEEELQLNELALPKEVRISGIFRADRFAPGTPLLVPLHLAQELSGAGDTGSVRGVALRLSDPYKAQQVLDHEVRVLIPMGWQPVTWMEQFAHQFSLISQQKTMMMLALSFIMLIAIFSISAVMFTVTLQKKREIGVMKALGATPLQVTNVFAFQGVIVGFVGSLAGLGLSLLVLHNLPLIQDGFRAMGFDPFSTEFYGSDLPYEINKIEMAVTVVAAFVLCTLAAYLPAWFASRTDAARSLRNL